MFRIFVFILLLCALAYGYSWMAASDGLLSITWLGYQIELSLFLGIILTTLTLILLGTICSVVRGIITTPARLYSGFNSSRKQSNLLNTIKGAQAMIFADYKTAKGLGGYSPELQYYLDYQLAIAAGKTADQEQILHKLLAFKDSKTIAAKALIELKITLGKFQEALLLAHQAMSYDSQASWPILCVIDLEERLMSIADAIGHLSYATKRKLIATELAKHKLSRLLYKDAQNELQNPVAAQSIALKKLQQACEADPSYVDAHLKLAIYLCGQNKQDEALSWLGKCWQIKPNMSLALLYLKINNSSGDEENFKHLTKLAKNVTDTESILVVAYLALHLNLQSEVRKYLAMIELKCRDQAYYDLCILLELKQLI